MDVKDACQQERLAVAWFAAGRVRGVEPDVVLARVAECFPLGRGLDPVDLGAEPPSGERIRPFGLRHLTPLTPDRTDVIIRSEISYDALRQISTVRGEPFTAAATQQRTSYATRTKEDRQEFDDVEEDSVEDVDEDPVTD